MNNENNGNSYEGKDLTGQKFEDTYYRTSFRKSTLTNATLAGTFLKTDFSEATLNGANFSAGSFVKAIFTEATLDVKELKQAREVREVTLPDGTVYSKDDQVVRRELGQQEQIHS